MQTSSLPKRLPVPFAQNGEKQTIPVASQVGITGGRASYNDGFPVLTRTPLSGGGIPPFGTDFNGVLNEITAAVRWQQSGGGYPYDSEFSTTISGYPKGSLIPNSTNSGFWLNTVDANTTNPENTTSALTGWVPSENYGVTAITGLSASSVTLSTLQASKERITLAGTLSSNINLILPAWTKRWTIVNGCSGSYNITVKTPSGTGVSIPSGLTANIIGDGTNITQDLLLFGTPGRLINIQYFTASGTYTPTAGTKTIRVTVTGAGGGGSGSNANSTSQTFSGAGGGAGGTAIKLISNPDSSYVLSVGSPGAGSTGSGSASKGGNSTFGSIITAIGGGGGALGSSGSTAGGGGAGATGGDINISGGDGSDGQSLTYFICGNGGASYFGGGGRSGNQGGIAGKAYGSGGGGAYDTNFSGTTKPGASGAGGVIIVEEYS